MDCQRIRTELGEHAAGQLPKARRAVLEAHIADCPACREAHAEETALRALIEDVVVYRGPAYSFAQLRRRMEAIEPLQEVLVLLPKLQKIGATPSFAIAMVLLVWLGGVVYASRNARGLYAVCQEPVLEQRYVIGREFPEIYKTLYVRPVAEERHRSV